jgi:hypothetical protein
MSLTCCSGRLWGSTASPERAIWETRPRQDFLAHCRYYMSDHRPIWALFRL